MRKTDSPASGSVGQNIFDFTSTLNILLFEITTVAYTTLDAHAQVDKKNTWDMKNKHERYYGRVCSLRTSSWLNNRKIRWQLELLFLVNYSHLEWFQSHEFLWHMRKSCLDQHFTSVLIKKVWLQRSKCETSCGKMSRSPERLCYQSSEVRWTDTPDVPSEEQF